MTATIISFPRAQTAASAMDSNAISMAKERLAMRQKLIAGGYPAEGIDNFMNIFSTWDAWKRETMLRELPPYRR